tara:strand:+ start:356 stop:694 length:339 start_codon:yes stop_codon:yes gene_type:complete
MDVKGTVTLICKEESGISKSEKVWRKQVIVVDTGAEYNPEIAVQAFGDDKIKDLNKLSVGDDVLIKCNVSSREYNGKYFHNIDGYWFAKKTPETAMPAEVVAENDESDDLPF